MFRFEFQHSTSELHPPLVFVTFDTDLEKERKGLVLGLSFLMLSFTDDAGEDEVTVQITDQEGRALALPKEEKRVIIII